MKFTWEALRTVTRGQAAGRRRVLGLGALLLGVVGVGLLVSPDLMLMVWLGVGLLGFLFPVIGGLHQLHRFRDGFATARRWAAGLSIFATLVIYASLQQRQLVPPLELLTLGVALALMGCLFAVFWVAEIAGGAIGLFFHDSARERADVGIRRGMHVWGVATLLFMFLPGLPVAQPGGAVKLWLNSSVPLATLIVCWLARNPEVDPVHFLWRGVRWLDRRFVVRTEHGQSILFYDFRGAGLGVIGATIVLLMATTGVFQPLQLQAVGPLIKLRASSPLFAYLGKEDPTAIDNPDWVVLEMDAVVKQEMNRRGAEARLQARVVRELTRLGARLIVLPAPVEGEPEAVAELENLAAAMRDSGRVVLLTHTGGAPSGGLARLPSELRRAAKAVAADDLGEFRVDWLKTIPAARMTDVPLPHVLVGELAGGSSFRSTVAAGSRSDRIINYLNRRGDEVRNTVAYTSLFWTVDPAPEDVRPATGSSPGLPTFADRIVLLDSPAFEEVDTPVGRMSPMELQGHALESLMLRQYIRPAPVIVGVLVTLLFGMIIGHVSLRRDPFRASWRGGLGVVVLSVLVGLVFLIYLVWLDPIVPIVAAIVSYLLVTQFTFSLEHGEVRRNRALLQRFVAPQVVEELLRDPGRELGLGGRRQNICVLFADIRDFTPYAEQHTPEEVIEVINAYMTALTEALHEHGGLLDKYTGDGLMALFRITETPPVEQIERAVLGALAMQEAARAVSRRLLDQSAQPLGVGISMHFGEAVVGLVGNPNQFNYTALGHTVVVAARLNSVAAADEVLISDAVYREVDVHFSCEAREEVRVKGLSTAVRSYCVKGSRRVGRGGFWSAG